VRTVVAIVFLTACSVAGAQPFSFLPAVTDPAGTGPVAATSTDFNNDGIPDLAISNASSIQIFLGKGDGTFTSAASILLSGQCVATSLTAGDFNNDHKIDILAVCLFESEVQVTLGTGSGQFGPPVVTSLPGLAMYGFFAMFNFQDLTVADFNGDGTLDMVIGTMTEFPETRLTLMTGNGDGTSQPERSSMTSLRPMLFLPAILTETDFPILRLVSWTPPNKLASTSYSATERAPFKRSTPTPWWERDSPAAWRWLT